MENKHDCLIIVNRTDHEGYTDTDVVYTALNDEDFKLAQEINGKKFSYDDDAQKENEDLEKKLEEFGDRVLFYKDTVEIYKTQTVVNRLKLKRLDPGELIENCTVIYFNS